eukprot:TRINITY_DN5710_c1_g1_i1.p2 TRINITY_DN5710_c1_g1~~TRINITY_DN5710_c1_g1_i1.p2  ORF type:complete len:191 (+),score=21.51 TRINITY_DN5710_c1_g1_i1:79-573(+)
MGCAASADVMRLEARQCEMMDEIVTLRKKVGQAEGCLQTMRFRSLHSNSSLPTVVSDDRRRTVQFLHVEHMTDQSLIHSSENVGKPCPTQGVLRRASRGGDSPDMASQLGTLGNDFGSLKWDLETSATSCSPFELSLSIPSRECGPESRKLLNDNPVCVGSGGL